MIIFLYGSDSYRLKQAKSEFINRYQAKYASGVNIFYFDFSEINDLSSLDNALRISSFFNEHKLMVCQNLFNKKTTSDKMTAYLQNQKIFDYPDATLLVVDDLSEKELASKHKELFKLLSGKNNTVKIIHTLEGISLAKWIKQEFQDRNCLIQSDAIKKLIEIIGNTSWALINEINKLANYSNGGEIKAQQVELLTHQSTDLNIFNLIDAVAQKNKLTAYGLLYQELKSNRDPYYILTMIIYQFRNLLNIKGLQDDGYSQAEIAKKAKLHPFVVKKSSANLLKISGEELKNKYNKLLWADTSFKTGQNNLADTLFTLINSY